MDTATKSPVLKDILKDVISLSEVFVKEMTTVDIYTELESKWNHVIIVERYQTWLITVSFAEKVIVAIALLKKHMIKIYTN